MEYSKSIIASNKNYKITFYTNESIRSEKCVITFGEIDSNLDEEGFGSKLVMKEGMDHIYVAQRRHTQYQFLPAEKFRNTIKPYIYGKEIYTYGSSLGGYCAIYYGGAIDANILAMSPRIPAHPVINKLMHSRFKNMGFKHKELENAKTSDKRICIFYDTNNYIDNYYINFFLKLAYPDVEYYYVKNAGHYSARALLLSKELKNVALNFFYNKSLYFTLNNEEILDWHINIARQRVKKGNLGHAQENIEVLLSSEMSNDRVVQDIVSEYKKKLTPRESKKKKNEGSILHPVISEEESVGIDKSVSISLSGSLTLSHEQSFNAFNHKSGKYEFDSMFSYITKYLTESDFSIGVFKGLTDTEVKKNKNVTLDTDFKLIDNFAHSIYRSGFDFVTTAHNHLLDGGITRAMSILDILDNTGLHHSGSFRDIKEKEKLPIYNIKGLKIAILTYTKSSDGYRSDFFLKDENKYLTSILVPPNNKNFDRVKADVLNDIEKVKKEGPDCILVLSHIGKKLINKPDKTQRVWSDIFVNAGVDIIYNDHANTVQPYEWRKKPGEDTSAVIINCLGDLVSSYSKNKEDASVLTQVYLDPHNGKPFALGCIPLWSHSYVDSIYRALPMYNIINDKKLRRQVSTFEFSRISDLHDLVTKTMLGEQLKLDHIQEKYFLFSERSDEKSKGFVRNRVAPLPLKKDMRNKEIFQSFSKARKVCFVGDSITEGTKNGGYGWFEPLVENFKHLKVQRFAKGGADTRYLLNNAKKIADIDADLFVVAIGTNDMRLYRSGDMTAERYIENIKCLVKKIQSKNQHPNFVFIAPWFVDSQYPQSEEAQGEISEPLKEFIIKLKEFTESENFQFINPNPMIKEKVKTRNPEVWLEDRIHPNANAGIELCSLSVIQSSDKKNFRPLAALESIFSKNQ